MSIYLEQFYEIDILGITQIWIKVKSETQTEIRQEDLIVHFLLQIFVPRMSNIRQYK